MQKLAASAISLMVLASCATTPIGKKEVAATGINVKKTVLDNGLTVLIS
jgi:hypothetical protein